MQRTKFLNQEFRIFEIWNFGSGFYSSKLFLAYTLYLIPHTLYFIPYTLYLIPYTFYFIPYTLYLIPYTLFLIPYAYAYDNFAGHAIGTQSTKSAVSKQLQIFWTEHTTFLIAPSYPVLAKQRQHKAYFCHEHRR